MTPLLEIRNLRTYYPIQRGIFARTVGAVRAVGPRRTRGPVRTRRAVGPGRAGRSRDQSSGRHNQKRLFHVISFSRLPMTQAAARGRACLF